jgi:DNA invertase Pin-like site-specific DNA recombinase
MNGSKVALAARMSVVPLSGTGAAFYRISSKKQEIKSQYEGVENWLIRRRAKVDPTHVFDFVVKRRKTAEHVDFKRLLDWVRAGRIQWIVVQDLDRFGTRDPNQLMGFLGELRDSGCQLWSVADDRCMNDGSDEAVLMACIKGITSEKECWVKSDRAHRTKQDMAQDGRWLGGPIPYGFDIECRRGGAVIWRYVLDKAVRVTEDVKGRPTTRYAFRGVVIEDGRETQVEALPQRNRRLDEQAYLVESIRPERKEALGLIFSWYSTENATPYEISKRLNTRGIPAVHGEAWYPEKIKHILKNPAYQGMPAAYKTTQSGYFRYAGIDPETGARMMGKAPDKSGKGGRYARQEWVSPKERAFDPLVDPALSEAAIERSQKPDRRKKAPKSPALWLSGLVVCDRCGKPMAGNMPMPDPRRKKLNRTYVCSTYLKFKGDSSTGCRAHRSQHDLIEKYLTLYLDDLGKSLEDYKQAHNNPERLLSLLRQSEKTRGLLEDYANRLDRMIRQVDPSAVAGYSEWASLKPPFGRFLIGEDIPAEWSEDAVRLLNIPNLLAYYEGFSTSRKAEVERIIKAKEAEFDRLVVQFAGLTSARAKERANAMMEALEVEIESLKAELPGLEVKVSSVFQELCDLHRRTAEARVALQIGSDEQKAEAARRAVKEIRLTFRYEDHSAAVWSKVDRIIIVPHMGEPVALQAEVRPAGRPKGGQEWVSEKNAPRNGSSPIFTSTIASPTN